MSPAAEMMALAERLATPPAISPEQQNEDQRIDAEQVAVAAEWLSDPNPEQRLGGAEQLGAYPTPESEQLLIKALLSDPDNEVRSAAARSLERFRQPSAQTLRALLDALGDKNPEVQTSSLLSLQIHLSNPSFPAADRKRVMQQLERKARDRRVQNVTREAIASFLADQE